MNLIDKINDKSAKVGVIGLGYVGLPLAIEFTNAGYEVMGIDIDKNKVNSINSGKNYIKDVKNDVLKNAVNKKLLTASTNFILGINFGSGVLLVNIGMPFHAFHFLS